MVSLVWCIWNFSLLFSPTVVVLLMVSSWLFLYKCEKKKQNGESEPPNSKPVSSGIKYDDDLEAGVDCGTYSEGGSAEVSDFESDSFNETGHGVNYLDGKNSYADYTVDDV
ncbi:hypothetical protein T10_4716 [Trichinella papuae]|uniref:Uncharacterized protein n=1 Tax=Trichinella papuae TaxID=268474 RepID=A0A0V1M7F1_9BILA|nr:hypothetical protein T10_4716 [Trichinella papuae]